MVRNAIEQFAAVTHRQHIFKHKCRHSFVVVWAKYPFKTHLCLFVVSWGNLSGKCWQMVVFYSNSLSPHPSSSRSHPLDPICPYLRSFTAPPPPIIEGRCRLNLFALVCKFKRSKKALLWFRNQWLLLLTTPWSITLCPVCPFQPVYFTSLTSAPKEDDDDGSFDDA